MHSVGVGRTYDRWVESNELLGLSPSISSISIWFHVPCPLDVTVLILAKDQQIANSEGKTNPRFLSGNRKRNFNFTEMFSGKCLESKRFGTAPCIPDCTYQFLSKIAFRGLKDTLEYLDLKSFPRHDETTSQAFQFVSRSVYFCLVDDG